MTDKKANQDKDNKDDKKVFDVSKPGESTAEATSKPVIVRRKRIEKDPMVVDPAEARDKEDKALVKDKPEEIKITSEGTQETKKEKDPNQDEPEPKPDPTSEELKTQDSISNGEGKTESQNSTEEADSGQDSAEPDKTDESKPDEDKSGAGEVEALAEEADASKQSKRQAEIENKNAQQLEQLINSRKYFLNIGEIKRRRTTTRLFIILIVIIILAAATYNFVLDAGIVTSNSIQPVTDIL